MSARLLIIVAIVAGSLFTSISVVADDPPRKAVVDDEERRFRLFESRQLIEQNCRICHSEELIAHQRLSPKQWTGEVEKMIGWGSPLPAADASKLAEFLAEQYPSSGPPPVAERKSIAADLRPVAISPVLGNPSRGAALYASGCANCHGITARGAEVGPNLVEKPCLLEESEFARVVLKGRGKMPASETVLKAEQVTDILAWLRTLR